jgi:ATP-binding cassette subfamily F protein 3
VFSHVNLTIKRGEKVAFVGKNGEGKSTLVKCIMGEIPFDGNLKIGHNVQIGYFAQNQAQLLDDELTVFQTIDNVAKGDVRLRINDILGAFMFGGENSDKKVKVLSGGERSRLAMIRLLLEQVNLLILDEPTNHLDMASKDVLKDAIRAFDGTAIIVSHDREFLDGLVTKVYEFGGGRVREYLGGIYEWIEARGERLETRGERLEVKGERIPQGGKSLGQNAPSSSVPLTPSAPKNDYAAHKEKQKRLNKAMKAVKESERKIEQMEKRLAELDALFADPANASDMTLVTEYTDLKRSLDAEMERWEQLSEEVEQTCYS